MLPDTACIDMEVAVHQVLWAKGLVNTALFSSIWFRSKPQTTCTLRPPFLYFFYRINLHSSKRIRCTLPVSSGWQLMAPRSKRWVRDRWAKKNAGVGQREILVKVLHHIQDIMIYDCNILQHLAYGFEPISSNPMIARAGRTSPKAHRAPITRRLGCINPGSLAWL